MVHRLGGMKVLVTAVTTVVVAAVSKTGFTTLGSLILIVLIATLITREICRHSGKTMLLSLNRGLQVALVPLSLTAGIVLLQQFAQHVF